MPRERSVSRIISRYLFMEMIPPFLINVAVFTFIFLMTLILDITNMIVNYRISVVTVLRMLIYSMPFFLEFIIPMSVMMTILLTFLRLSSDNEITALKSSGTSIYAMVPPVMLFCLAGALLTAFMAIYGLPWGRTSFKALSIEVASSNLDLGLKERTFNDRFKNVVLYVNRIDLRRKMLIDVFIEDQRTPNVVSTVVAPRGRLFSDPENLTFHLKLFNGTISQVELGSKTAHTINFDRYDISLGLEQAFTKVAQGPKDEEEMSLAELSAYLRNSRTRDAQYYLTLMEYHKKFSIPLACFSLGLLAMPLGAQSRSARKSFGVGLGLAFFLLYYILLSMGWVFGEAGVYPPAIGMWLPNGVMGSLGIFLLVRNANEKPVRLLALFGWLRWRLVGRRRPGRFGR